METTGITGLSQSAASYQAQPTEPQQRRQNFQALATSLQSGDLAGAQQAFAALFGNASGNAATSSTSTASAAAPLSQDMKTLASALQSGSLADAQKAFEAVKADLQSLQQAHRGHRHHHHKAAEPVSATSQPPATSDGSTINTTA